MFVLIINHFIKSKLEILKLNYCKYKKLSFIERINKKNVSYKLRQKNI